MISSAPVWGIERAPAMATPATVCPAASRLQQHGGAEIIDAGVVLDLIHALADTDQGREVNHGIDTAQRPLQGVAVAHVTAQEFDIRGEVIGTRPGEVDLRHERVVRAHLVPGGQKFIGDIRPNETSPACD